MRFTLGCLIAIALIFALLFELLSHQADSQYRFHPVDAPRPTVLLVPTRQPDGQVLPCTAAGACIGVDAIVVTRRTLPGAPQ